MFVQPREQNTDAAGSHCDTRIGIALVQVDAFSSRAFSGSTRKHDIFDVSFPFLSGFRADPPGIASLQAHFRLLPGD